MIYDYCDVTTKEAFELSNSIMGVNKKEKIKLPTYQRSLVWSNKQKNEFIESLKRGYPVGAILLHKKGEKAGVTEYLIIDGLQRTTTINSYIQKPTSFNIDSDLNEPIIEEKIEALCKKIQSKYKANLTIHKFKNYLLDYLASKDVGGFDEAKGYSAWKCMRYFDSQLGIILKDMLFNDSFVEILSVIKKNAEIDKIKIPVIIYSGPAEQLPEIFRRLNTGGTQLNKYQIFAAMWDNKRITIQNQEIIEKIQNRYASLVEEGLSIDEPENQKNNQKNNNYNIFEYLFGLGKYLTSGKYEKYKILFKTEVEQEPETFIFVLATVTLKLEIKKMGELDTKIIKIIQSDFENAIIDSIEQTYKILSPILNFNFNINKGKEDKNISNTFSESQILSIVAYLLLEKYDDNFKVKKDLNKKNHLELHDNILLFYLYDVISGYWESSTDTQITNTLSPTQKRYHQKIDKRLWDLAYETYFEEQLNKRHKDRTLINKRDLLLLRYIYSRSISSYADNSNKSYQIDHILPVQLLKERAKNINEGMPISAVGNLCLLTSELNLDKNDDTIKEYISKKQATLPENKIKKIQKEFENSVFLSIEEIPTRKNIALDTYKDFLDKRHSVLKEKFYEMYNIGE